MDSGFCFVTFSEHTAPVTAVAFLPTSSACVSASLDGTVRAWDLLRYRNFRTMTSPDPVQLASLAVDPAGEVCNLLHSVALLPAMQARACPFLGLPCQALHAVMCFEAASCEGRSARRSSSRL